MIEWIIQKHAFKWRVFNKPYSGANMIDYKKTFSVQNVFEEDNLREFENRLLQKW